MYNTKGLLRNIAGALAYSIIGAILMMALDPGGTRWLKFILYVLFFASVSPAVFSSHLSCSSMLRRLRKRRTAYLARRLRDLDPDEVTALERAAEILERLLEGERR